MIHRSYTSKLIMYGIMMLFTMLHGFSQVQNSEGNYTKIAKKAARFYNYGDWNSAVAMYELMLAQRPKATDTYADASVAAAMASDSLKLLSLIERAQLNAIPVDSMLWLIRSKSTSLNRPEIYADFLILEKKAHPWAARMVDVRLLDFYNFRHDTENVIATAQRLLKASPDNIGFLTTLANAYLDKSNFDSATAVFKRILELQPDNLPSLISLGNYYYSIGDTNQALHYLRRAQELEPTPHLQRTIDQLIEQ